VTRLVAGHSVVTEVVEISLRALVIAAGETAARVHVAQFTALGHMVRPSARRRAAARDLGAGEGAARNE